MLLTLCVYFCLKIFRIVHGFDVIKGLYFARSLGLVVVGANEIICAGQSLMSYLQQTLGEMGHPRAVGSKPPSTLSPKLQDAMNIPKTKLR